MRETAAASVVRPSSPTGLTDKFAVVTRSIDDRAQGKWELDLIVYTQVAIRTVNRKSNKKHKNKEQNVP